VDLLAAIDKQRQAQTTVEELVEERQHASFLL